MRKVGAFSRIDSALRAAVPHERTADAGYTVQQSQVFALVPLMAQQTTLYR